MNRQQLVESIIPWLLKNGVKNLTMDSVAKGLGISKRTLYEIFDNKDTMVREVIDVMMKSHHDHIVEITKKCDNVMEAVIIALKSHGKSMSDFGPSFYRDLEGHCPELRPYFEQHMTRDLEYLYSAIKIGVKQGVFRADEDYNIIFRLFFIQMESLKRMERYFPKEVTLLQAFNTIILYLLRSIATPKGMEILDRNFNILNPQTEENFNDNDISI